MAETRIRSIDADFRLYQISQNQPLGLAIASGLGRAIGVPTCRIDNLNPKVSIGPAAPISRPRPVRLRLTELAFVVLLVVVTGLWDFVNCRALI